MRLINEEKGGSNMLSAAALLPVMVLITLAVVQITLLVNAKMTVRESAFEALRTGVKSDLPVETAANTVYKYSNLPGWVKGGNVKVTSYLNGPANNRVLNVEVTYNVPVINRLLLTGSRQGFIVVRSGLIQRRLEDSI